jgi:hypothetical protein
MNIKGFLPEDRKVGGRVISENKLKEILEPIDIGITGGGWLNQGKKL